MENLSNASFEESKDKSFETIRIFEMLCEVCGKLMSTREKTLRKIQISTKEDCESLLSKALIHDGAQIDMEKGKIHF